MALKGEFLYLSPACGAVLLEQFRQCFEVEHGLGTLPTDNAKSQLIELARPARVERATHCLEGSCSIQLSYGRSAAYFARFQLQGKLLWRNPKAGQTRVGYVPGPSE